MYLSRAEFETRFGATEVDGLVGHLSAPDADSKILNAIEDAESAINSYLSKRYDVPLLNVTTHVKRMTGDIARYYLWDDAASSEVETRYNQTMALLKDIAADKANLAGSTDQPGVDASTGSNQVHVIAPQSQLDMSKF